MSQCDMLRMGGLPYELHQMLWGRLCQINLNLRPAVPRMAGNEISTLCDQKDSLPDSLIVGQQVQPASSIGVG